MGCDRGGGPAALVVTRQQRRSTSTNVAAGRLRQVRRRPAMLRCPTPRLRQNSAMERPLPSKSRRHAARWFPAETVRPLHPDNPEFRLTFFQTRQGSTAYAMPPTGSAAPRAQGGPSRHSLRKSTPQGKARRCHLNFKGKRVRSQRQAAGGRVSWSPLESATSAGDSSTPPPAGRSGRPSSCVSQLLPRSSFPCLESSKRHSDGLIFEIKSA